MILDDIHRDVHTHKKRRRLGRGPGSGHGKTSGRGHKGQGQLAGWTNRPTFQGGTTPVIQRVPKRGFNNRWGKKVVVVNVGEIDKAFDAGTEVTLELLASKNVSKGRYDVLKILGNGQLTKKFKIHGHQFSKSALEKINSSGGEAVVVPGRTPVEEKKRKKAEQAGS